VVGRDCHKGGGWSDRVVGQGDLASGGGVVGQDVMGVQLPVLNPSLPLVRRGTASSFSWGGNSYRPMADQEEQVNAFKRAWPNPKPPAVKAGTKKRGASCRTDSDAGALSEVVCSRHSLGMVVLSPADLDRFRQGIGAPNQPPPSTSPALKTGVTFLSLARASRRFGQAELTWFSRRETGAWPTFGTRTTRSRCA